MHIAPINDGKQIATSKSQSQNLDKKREAGICPGIVPHNDPDTSPLE